LRCEVLGIDSVHRGEIIHVFEVNVRLHDAIEGGSGSFKDGFQILESAPCLFGDSAGDELLCRRIKRGLSGSEDEVAAAYALRVRSNCLGRRRGGDNSFAHEAILAGGIPWGLASNRSAAPWENT
jgi:hypothetical protein